MEQLAQRLQRLKPAPMRRVWRQLLGDLASLLANVRQCVMLDYVLLTPAQVRTQLARVWQQSAPLLRSVEALELDGVVFLMLRSATVQRLSHHLQRMRSEGETAGQLDGHDGDDGAGHSPPPLWVKVDGEDAPRELHHVEVAARLPHLHAFVRALQEISSSSLDDTDASLRWQDLGTEGWGSATHIVPLPLPTLAGWLLEYPAVYVFEPWQGTSAARNLSCSSLMLHRISTSCDHITRLVSVTEGGGGGVPDTHEGADIVLLSFSIPSELLPAASSSSECAASEQEEFGVRLDGAVRALVARMARRAERSGATEGEGEKTREAPGSESTAALRGELRWTAPRLHVEVRAPYVVAL